MIALSHQHNNSDNSNIPVMFIDRNGISRNSFFPSLNINEFQKFHIGCRFYFQFLHFYNTYTFFLNLGILVNVLVNRLARIAQKTVFWKRPFPAAIRTN